MHIGSGPGRARVGSGSKKVGPAGLYIEEGNETLIGSGPGRALVGSGSKNVGPAGL